MRPIRSIDRVRTFLHDWGVREGVLGLTALTFRKFWSIVFMQYLTCSAVVDIPCGKASNSLSRHFTSVERQGNWTRVCRKSPVYVPGPYSGHRLPSP